MRTFTDNDIEEFVTQNQIFCNYFCGFYIEYKDDNDVWQVLEDVLDFNYRARSDTEETTVYSLMPTADTLSFKVFNQKDKYTVGGGGEFDGVLTPDRLVRLKLFWRIPESLAKFDEVTDDFAGEEHYHTQESGGELILDSGAAPAAPQFFDLLLYDEGVYNGGLYSAPGYYVSEPIIAPFQKIWNQVPFRRITCNKEGSSKITLLYRSNSFGTWTAWSSEIELSTGQNIIDFDTDAQSIQIAIKFYSDTWNATDKVTDLTVVYAKTTEEFDFGTFYMNVPRWPNTEQDPVVNIQCNNIFKKILDKKRITSKYYSTEELVSTLIKDCLEIAGLTSSDYDIPDTTTTIRNPTIYTEARLGDIFDDCLNKLQLEDDYRLFIQDEKITLAVIDKDGTAEYVLDDRFHNFQITRVEDAENQAIYATVFSDDITLPTSGTPAGEVDLLQANASGSSTGDVTITNFKVAPVNHYPAVNIRPVIVTTGDFEVTEIHRKIHTASPEIKFRVTGISGTYNIGVRGVVITAGVNVGFKSEDAGDGLNQRDGLGKQIKYINPLIDNDADANALAQFIYDYNSEKKTKISAKCLPIPQLEVNDNVTLVSLKLQEVNIYVVSMINIRGKAREGVTQMQLQLIDNSQDLGNFIYDANGAVAGASDFFDDRGWIYDQDIFTEGVDTATYTPKIKI